MKNAGVMLLIVVLVGVACIEGGDLRKRFLIASTYDSAKDEFNKVASDVDFDATVNALIPYIHSDMTVFACTGVCVASAASFLGAAAALAPLVCPPLCDGALAKLEETAG